MAAPCSAFPSRSGSEQKLQIDGDDGAAFVTEPKFADCVKLLLVPPASL